MTGPALPGIGSHHSARRLSDEWYTPPEIVQALPQFDLDPCAPAAGVPAWQSPRMSYSVVDDGLSLPWFGHVWCNPPYSNIEPWMARMAEHDDGVALVFGRCETRWWFDSVWPRAAALLFLAGRVTFWRPGPDGASQPSPAGHSSGGPSVLIGYGPWAASVLRACRLRGAFVTGALVRSAGNEARS